MESSGAWLRLGEGPAEGREEGQGAGGGQRGARGAGPGHLRLTRVDRVVPCARVSFCDENKHLCSKPIYV